MEQIARIDTLYIGGVRQIGDEAATHPLQQPWTTAAFKQATDQSVWLAKDGLHGDNVADTRFHGGTEKALFAYCADHYTAFSHKYHQNIPVGSNGENIAVRHMNETSVCIGDIYQIGEAVVQVSQPRRPCWKPSRRLGILEFAEMLEETGHTGWYYRVLQEGYIQRGDELILQERPYPEWSIQRMNDVLNHSKDIKLMQALKDASFTPESWQNTLDKRIAGEEIDHTARLYGPNIEHIS
ncbi:MOSC domain-containing protein [Staphylococcus sp. 17KM0847]|uniref:MOSC domain-containing protein n=1 Tax=Staphylococcus sp. 17KM0847 TaxID=2583989 RepID=UPI0015DC3A08|nr:MOSC domain-containing protein [Staphylococcus sp. 17KM0847]QLK86855.1 MOSC domain-containing protein [Staphylococcus sp. 17KM0847]